VSGRTFGRTGVRTWQDRVVIALLLACGAGTIAMIYKLDARRRADQARLLLDGEMAPEEVVREVRADWVDVNASAPGSAVDPGALAHSKPHTIVVWASGHCDASRDMLRCLRRIACLKTDCAVRHVEVDRPGARGIDWESPAAAPLPAPRVVPYLAVYDGGKRVAEGKPAKALVKTWYEATFAERRP
jgi:hypothetical protein